MGLDISVYKPYSIGKKKPKDIENFAILEEHPELACFKKLAFKKTNEYYDLKTAAKKKGYKLEDLQCRMMSAGRFEFEDNQGKRVVLKPKTFKKKELCLAIEEIAYQRKGANSKFYEDEAWNSKCITSRRMVSNHWKKYFSKNTPASKGGWGWGVEFKLANKEMKETFKKNIVDKFVEGKTFLMYH